MGAFGERAQGAVPEPLSVWEGSEKDCRSFIGSDLRRMMNWVLNGALRKTQRERNSLSLLSPAAVEGYRLHL